MNVSYLTTHISVNKSVVFWLSAYHPGSNKFNLSCVWGALPGGASGKEPACQYRLDIRDSGSILGQDDPREKEMTTHSSILAWRIPWTEEPGGLQSIGSQESDTAEAT